MILLVDGLLADDAEMSGEDELELIVFELVVNPLVDLVPDLAVLEKRFGDEAGDNLTGDLLNLVVVEERSFIPNKDEATSAPFTSNTFFSVDVAAIKSAKDPGSRRLLLFRVLLVYWLLDKGLVGGDFGLSGVDVTEFVLLKLMDNFLLGLKHLVSLL